MRNALKKLIQATVKRGEFKLASGRTSDIYVDVRAVTMTSIGANLVGELMQYMLSLHHYDAVGGPSIGADPVIVSMLCHSSHLRGFMVRREPKNHGLPGLVVGQLKEGDHYVIVDDVATSGSSMLRAVRAAEQEVPGVRCVAAACVLDRQEGAREMLGIDFYSLFKLEEFRDG